jgi:hypothetical protein
LRIDDAGRARRSFRDSPLGKALILVLVLVAAFLVARSCGATRTEVSQDQAIEIAKRQVDFEPNNVMVRVVNQGVPPEPDWFVSLSRKQPDGTLTNVTVVVVDGETGEVLRVRRSS